MQLFFCLFQMFENRHVSDYIDKIKELMYNRMN